jgi:hypothetical protein
MALQFLIAIALTVLVSFAIRLLFVAEPLWIDELHTAWAIDAHFSAVAQRAGEGNQMPLHFWLTWLLTSLTGKSQLLLRLPSLLCGLTTVAVSMSLVCRFTNKLTAMLFTGLIAAIDYWFVFYSVEARPYALLQLLGVLQICAFASVVARTADTQSQTGDDSLAHSVALARPCNFVLILGLSIALWMTHLTCVWLFLAETMFLVWTSIRGRSCWRLLWPLAISVVGLAPGIGFVGRMYATREAWEPISDLGRLVMEFGRQGLVCLLVPAIFWTASRWRPLSRLAAGQWRTPIATEDSAARNLPPGRFKPVLHREVLVLLAFCGITPLAASALLCWLDVAPLAHYRYIQVGTAALPILAGLIISQIDSPKIQCSALISGIIVAVAASPIAQQVVLQRNIPTFRNEDWQSVVDQINGDPIKSRQPVFLFSNLIEDSQSQDRDPSVGRSAPDYYRFPLTGIYKFEPPREIICLPLLIPDRWNREYLDLIFRSDGCWLVIRASFDDAFEVVRELETAAGSRGAELQCEIRQQERNSILVVAVDSDERDRAR